MIENQPPTRYVGPAGRWPTIHDDVRQKLSAVRPATCVKKVSFCIRCGASNFLVGSTVAPSDFLGRARRRPADAASLLSASTDPGGSAADEPTPSLTASLPTLSCSRLPGPRRPPCRR